MFVACPRLRARVSVVHAAPSSARWQAAACALPSPAVPPPSSHQPRHDIRAPLAPPSSRPSSLHRCSGTDPAHRATRQVVGEGREGAGWARGAWSAGPSLCLFPCTLGQANRQGACARPVSVHSCPSAYVPTALCLSVSKRPQSRLLSPPLPASLASCPLVMFCGSVRSAPSVWTVCRGSNAHTFPPCRVHCIASLPREDGPKGCYSQGRGPPRPCGCVRRAS